VLRGIDKVSNRVIILDLNTVLTGSQSDDSYELVMNKGSNDISIRSLDPKTRAIQESTQG